MQALDESVSEKVGGEELGEQRELGQRDLRESLKKLEKKLKKVLDKSEAM